MSVIPMEILVFLTCGLTALATLAQQERVARVGLVGLDQPECENQPLRDGLHELGYIEGRALVIDCRDGARRYQTLQRAADELAATKPDVIVALTISTRMPLTGRPGAYRSCSSRAAILLPAASLRAFRTPAAT